MPQWEFFYSLLKLSFLSFCSMIVVHRSRKHEMQPHWQRKWSWVVSFLEKVPLEESFCWILNFNSNVFQMLGFSHLYFFLFVKWYSPSVSPSHLRKYKVTLKCSRVVREHVGMCCCVLFLFVVTFCVSVPAFCTNSLQKENLSAKYGKAWISSILGYVASVERAHDSYKCEIALKLCYYNLHWLSACCMYAEWLTQHFQ